MQDQVLEQAQASKSTAPVLLQVKGLKVGYGGIQAVKGVDFQVHQGELVSLIGSNGAGKTTTMKAVTRGLPIADGEILYLGKASRARAPGIWWPKAWSWCPRGAACSHA
jgi:branched-chain amino acid transport system ATP-binding protein